MRKSILNYRLNVNLELSTLTTNKACYILPTKSVNVTPSSNGIYIYIYIYIYQALTIFPRKWSVSESNTFIWVKF